MGGRGGSSASAATPRFTPEETALMEAAMNRTSTSRSVTKYAEDVFKGNRREAESFIRRWGYDGTVFQNLNYKEGVGVSSSTRTLNDILELCNRQDRQNSRFLKYDTIDESEFLFRTQAVQMVRGTVLNIMDKKRRGVW